MIKCESKVQILSFSTVHWTFESSKSPVQYCVCSPLETIAAWQRLPIDHVRFLMTCCGLLAHFACSAFISCCSDCTVVCLWRMRLSKSKMFYRIQVWRFGWPLHNIFFFGHIFLFVLKCVCQKHRCDISFFFYFQYLFTTNINRLNGGKTSTEAPFLVLTRGARGSLDWTGWLHVINMINISYLKD